MAAPIVRSSSALTLISVSTSSFDWNGLFFNRKKYQKCRDFNRCLQYSSKSRLGFKIPTAAGFPGVFYLWQIAFRQLLLQPDHWPIPRCFRGRRAVRENMMNLHQKWCISLFKMMHFVSNTRKFVLKRMNVVLKMMNFAGKTSTQTRSTPSIQN